MVRQRSLPFTPHGTNHYHVKLDVVPLQSRLQPLVVSMMGTGQGLAAVDERGNRLVRFRGREHPLFSNTRFQRCGFVQLSVGVLFRHEDMA